MNMPRLFLETPLSDRDAKAVVEYVERMVAYATAPTPEVEPVAYRKFNPRWGDYTYVSNPYPNASCEPLYTHPDQSELVKAAEEYIEYIGHYAMTDTGSRLLANLRAALDKVEP